MKRFISMLLALAMVCCLLSTVAFAAEVASGTCGDGLTWVLDEEGNLIISGTGEMYAEPSFGKYMEDIKSVVVEEGVTIIGSSAFYEAYNLASVSLPETLTCISVNAFKNTAITELVIPDGVTEIWEEAFKWNTQLKKVTLGNSLTYIGDYVFYNTALTEITIPASVTMIGWDAFGCWESAGYDSELTQIKFLGDAPQFADKVFSGVTATAYYPANNSTWTEDVMASYGGNITWVSYEPDSSDDTTGNSGEFVVTNWEELKAAVEAAQADSEQVFTIKWDMWRDIEIAESIEIPENCVFNPGILLIPEGVTMTVSSGFSTISGIEVSGKLITPELLIRPEVGGSLWINETGSVDIPYIRVTDTEYPEENRLDSILYGLDQSLYNVEEVGYGDWVLTLKAEEVPGDADGNGIIDDSDVAQLLWYTLFPDSYTVAGNADFNGDSIVDDADVAYLLWHTLFPDAYPLN